MSKESAEFLSCGCSHLLPCPCSPVLAPPQKKNFREQILCQPWLSQRQNTLYGNGSVEMRQATFIERYIIDSRVTFHLAGVMPLQETGPYATRGHSGDHRWTIDGGAFRYDTLINPDIAPSANSNFGPPRLSYEKMSSISSRCVFFLFLRLFSLDSSATAAAMGLGDGLSRFLFFTITAWRNEGSSVEDGRVWSAASAGHRTIRPCSRSGRSQAHLAVVPQAQAQGPVRGNMKEAPGMSILTLAAMSPQLREKRPRRDPQKRQDHYLGLCACWVPVGGRTF
ncbi:hypothetical protein BC827DRAFT_707186 [Russula dissimulans]|nr:hypothetical protein BC827DRAFT_707186 [Russula dissimulans]